MVGWKAARRRHLPATLLLLAPLVLLPCAVEFLLLNDSNTNCTCTLQFSTVEVIQIHHGPRTSFLIYISNLLQLHLTDATPTYLPVTRSDKPQMEKRSYSRRMGDAAHSSHSVNRCFVSGAERSLSIYFLQLR